DLGDVAQVVSGPGSEELAQGNWSEGGVNPFLCKVFRREIHFADPGEVARAAVGELIEEGCERLSLTGDEHREAVDRVEVRVLRRIDDPADAHQPVGLLQNGEMADNIVGAPGIGAL